MKTLSLMIQGTTSDAGKSALGTGMCRLFRRMGFSVAPFKPQNMALNSAVAVNGGEIGRAQAVQALASGVPAHTDMNPVLLKPNSDQGAQVIVHGHPVGNMSAIEYHDFKPEVMQAILDSYRRLCSQHDMVIIEGAGSPAEINLRENDVANMGFAEAVNCPVILVADIDRGGVFAHITGTLELLSESERKRTRGTVINRFRGNTELLKPGIDWLEKRIDVPVLGVVPFLQDLHLEAEDRVTQQDSGQTGTLHITVPRLPRISNHTDLDALRLHPDIHLQLVNPGQSFPPADLIILPGSKNVCADLRCLREQRWDTAILKHLRYGGRLLGICGGFQMLGNAIHDRLAIEGDPGSEKGLCLLDMETDLRPEKRTENVCGRLTSAGQPIRGYEIHAGVCTGPALKKPFSNISQRPDGAISDDGMIAGTFVHGLFDHGQQWLFDWTGTTASETLDYPALREQGIDLLADTLSRHLDIPRTLNIMHQFRCES